MVDYVPLRSNVWKLPEPDLEPDEELPAPAPVTVDFVYNAHHDHKGTTIACKLVIQLPPQSSDGS